MGGWPQNDHRICEPVTRDHKSGKTTYPSDPWAFWGRAWKTGFAKKSWEKKRSPVGGERV